MLKYVIYSVLILLVFGCKSTDFVYDTIIDNAAIFVNNHVVKGKVGIKNGKIIKIDTAQITTSKEEAAHIIDAGGQFLMPGFIEGHGHFSGLGFSLLHLNFLNSKSWDDIVQQVGEKLKTVPKDAWIEGRGWHQEKWDSIPLKNVLNYPYHHSLSAISPDNPLILYHASGHALFANKKAMELARISNETPSPDGGQIVRDEKGEAIGVFEENAMELIQKAYQVYRDTLSEKVKSGEWYQAIDLAQNECLSKGITSFQDAGSKFFELDRYKQMALDDSLKIRLWAMVRHSAEEMAPKLAQYKAIGVGKDKFTCNAIKSEVDGALGAFGAWLLKPYNDKPNFVGQNTTDIYEVKKIGDLALKNDMQFCVHAIGDRANRVVLDVYEGLLSKSKQGDKKRWRIEHAQHLDTTDIPRFAKFGIIASMQGIHCTSDAPFVVRRLGVDRSKFGAYPWRSLLDNGVIIANGTDAPVEDVDPLKSLYASFTRKRVDSGLTFFPEQKMTRLEALRSYTIGNAYAAFEDQKKGSISVGKWADFVLLNTNLLTCSDAEILQAKVIWTMVGGKVLYRK